MSATLLFVFQVYFKADLDAWNRKLEEFYTESLTDRIAVVGWLFIIISLIIVSLIEIFTANIVDFYQPLKADYASTRILLVSLRAMICGPLIKLLDMYMDQVNLSDSNVFAFSTTIVYGYFYMFLGIGCLVYLFIFQVVIHNKRRLLTSSLFFAMAILLSGLLFITQGGHIYFADNYSLKVKKSTEKPKVIAHRLGSVIGPEGSAFNIQQLCSNTVIDFMELDIRVILGAIFGDPDLAVAHDATLGHYNDNYSKYDIINIHSMRQLREINIGKRWIRIDPYG